MWLLNGYGTLVLFSYPQNSLETLRYCDDCTFDWLMDFLAGEKISCHLHLHLLENGLARLWEILMFAHLTDCCTFFNKKIILPSWLLISSPLLSLFDFHIIFVSLIEFQPKKNFPTIPLLLQLSLKNSLGKRWKIVMFARLTDWLSYQRKTLQPSSSCLDKLRSTCVGNDEFDHFYCVGDVIITKQWEMCAS